MFALVSVFHNTDRQGDRVLPGAFKRTLKEWKTRGTKIPVVWSHHYTIADIVGGVDDAEETAEGLQADYTLHIKTNENARLLFSQIEEGVSLPRR